MDKLLRLLNIYSQDLLETNLKFTYDGNNLRVQGDEIGPYVAESIVINKKFGFIERLVKNDDINMNKVERDATSYFTDESPVYGDKIWITRLIMMLSVSNSPIKDLIYYLGKEDEDYYIKPGGYKLVFNAKK